MNKGQYTLWFTGLSGSGKTTIAKGLAKRLRKEGHSILVIDGDDARKFISYDLGYSIHERDKHITRIAGVCYLATANNIMSIACVLSPTRRIRGYARRLIGKFIEIHIKCPIEVCAERDVKGFYKKIENGTLTNFVGIDIPYEKPLRPEITVDTDKETVSESIDVIMNYLKERKII